MFNFWGSLHGGHAFICDGFRDDDYFHINWGWDMGVDGYFSLSALKPALGTLGDYTNFQQALLCLYPKSDTTAKCVLEMEEEINLQDSIPVGEEWKFYASIINMGDRDFSGYIYSVVYKYIDPEIPDVVLLDSNYVSDLYTEIYFDLESASQLPIGTYFVSIEYRDTVTGQLTPVKDDYFDNFKKVIVYNPIEMDLLWRFSWDGDLKEHWYVGDSIRFITQINNNTSGPFTGLLSMKLENVDNNSIYQYFDRINCMDFPIPPQGDDIYGLVGKLCVPPGDYNAFLIYKEDDTDEWKLVGCAKGMINPMPLTVEKPAEVEQYVILAQRKATANWFYLTSVNAGTEYTPHLEAVNSGTSDKTKIKTSDLDNNYIWNIESVGDDILLRNGNEYIAYTKGNTAYMGTDGIKLSSSITATGLTQYWFVDSNEDTRYLSLNLSEDYFSFYKGTQARDLLMLKIGEKLTTGMNNIVSAPSAIKVIRDNKVFILRDGKTYTLQGQEVQ